MKLRNKKTGEIVERIDLVIREEGVDRTIRFEIPFRAGYDSCEAEADLDLLFGGEDE